MGDRTSVVIAGRMGLACASKRVQEDTFLR